LPRENKTKIRELEDKYFGRKINKKKEKMV
jgi:hypothetical protein